MTDPGPDSRQPQLLYNGGCPVCRTGAEQYQRIGGSGDACGWVDVRAMPDVLTQHGISLKAVIYRVHYIDEAGHVSVGAPAIAALLDKDNRFPWLAKLMRLPVLKWIVAGLYELVAGPLYVWNMWRERRRSL